MAAANSTFTTDRRRSPAEVVVLLPPALRVRIEGMVAFLANLLDAADAEGEGAPDEASAQPVALSPDHSPVVTHRPSRRATRAASRRNCDPIPRNLRRFGSIFRSAHA